MYRSSSRAWRRTLTHYFVLLGFLRVNAGLRPHVANHPLALMASGREFNGDGK